MRIRTYHELSRIDGYLERFRYLQIKQGVGRETFGYDRYLNQRFYTSNEWKRARDEVIARDLGNDLGVDGFPILGRILVHHMNPMTAEMLHGRDETILDSEYLITTTHDTHNAIHYGDESLLRLLPLERQPGDTRLW